MSVGAVNKQTGDRIPTAGMTVVDSILSGSSTNPVQNRVVKAALDEKADTDIVASDFDATASYTAGDYCIYEGKFYKFKASHSGAWSASDVDEIKIAGELASLMSGLTSVGNTVDKIATSGIIWYPITFATTAHGGNYYAALNSLPTHTTATLSEVNELGVGALTLSDFTLVAQTKNEQSWIYTTNSAHAGKVLSAKITFA